MVTSLRDSQGSGVTTKYVLYTNTGSTDEYTDFEMLEVRVAIILLRIAGFSLLVTDFMQSIRIKTESHSEGYNYEMFVGHSSIK